MTADKSCHCAVRDQAMEKIRKYYPVGSMGCGGAGLWKVSETGLEKVIYIVLILFCVTVGLLY